jgi:hypothetical protein
MEQLNCHKHMFEQMWSMKNILVSEVSPIKKIVSKLVYRVSLIIEILLTLPLISPISSKIEYTLIIHFDKHSKRPSSRKIQSAKLTTLIFNFINVEDILSSFLR